MTIRKIFSLFVSIILIMLSCDSVDQRAKSDFNEETSMLLRDIKKYVREQYDCQGRGENCYLECIFEEVINADDYGPEVSLKSIRIVQPVKNPPSDSLNFRFDRVILFREFIVFSLSCSSRLDSNFCRVSCSRPPFVNLFIRRDDLSLIFSSSCEKYNYFLPPPMNEDIEFSWNIRTSEELDFDQAKAKLSQFLQEELKQYHCLRENFLDTLSLRLFLEN